MGNYEVLLYPKANRDIEEIYSYLAIDSMEIRELCGEQLSEIS